MVTFSVIFPNVSISGDIPCIFLSALDLCFLCCQFAFNLFFYLYCMKFIIVVCFLLGSEPEMSDNTGSFEMINTIGDPEVVDQNNIGEHASMSLSFNISIIHVTNNDCGTWCQLLYSYVFIRDNICKNDA